MPSSEGGSAVDHPGLLDAAATALRDADRVWIGTHLDPDGDAIGSLLGLGLVLETMGKQVRLCCQDAPPREAGWLPAADRIEAASPGGEDLLVALDAADPGRLGRIASAEDFATRPSLVIDHHRSNPGFGHIDLIDPGAASTAEILVELLDRMDIAPSPDAATCLLTGLITDTIGFRTSNTSASSLRRAGRLVEAGAELDRVNQMVFYRQPIGALGLIGQALDRLEMRGAFAWTWIARKDLARHGCEPGDTRELTRLVASAAEPAAVAILREREDGRWDLSLRSKPDVDLIPLARALGGGGHPQAAGARLDGPLERARDHLLSVLPEGLLDDPRSGSTSWSTAHASPDGSEGSS